MEPTFDGPKGNLKGLSDLAVAHLLKVGQQKNLTQMFGQFRHDFLDCGLKLVPFDLIRRHRHVIRHQINEPLLAVASHAGIQRDGGPPRPP